MGSSSREGASKTVSRKVTQQDAWDELRGAIALRVGTVTSTGRTASSPQSVGLVFGTRTRGGDLGRLPELVVGGLPEAEARALLEAVLAGPIDERVREQIVAETGGNPLPLPELPRGLTVAELAGGFGLPGAVPLTGSIEESFRRRVEAMPAQTPVAAAGGGGRPDRGSGAGVAGVRGTRDRGRGGPPRGRGRLGRVRGPGAVPAPAGPLGGLPVGPGPG
jgi:hypothetical protein